MADTTVSLDQDPPRIRGYACKYDSRKGYLKLRVNRLFPLFEVDQKIFFNQNKTLAFNESIIFLIFFEK